MSDVAAAFAVLAFAINPNDPALAFMALVAMAILIGEAAVLACIVAAVLAIEHWREPVRVVTDWQDDPALFGDFPHIAQGLRAVGEVRHG